jgi:hypothetical protein
MEAETVRVSWLPQDAPITMTSVVHSNLGEFTWARLTSLGPAPIFKWDLEGVVSRLIDHFDPL